LEDKSRKKVPGRERKENEGERKIDRKGRG